jgi:hypothetical protein
LGQAGQPERHHRDQKSLRDNRSTAILAAIVTGRMRVLRMTPTGLPRLLKKLSLSFRVVMGRRPTHPLESFKRRRPRESGDPRPVDSRFRGNDVTFDGAKIA